LVKAIIREMNLNEKLYRAASVHASISRAKNELILPDDFPINTYRDEVVKRVYTEYQKRLIASNAVDFDDILVYTAQLMENNPPCAINMPSVFVMFWWMNFKIPILRSMRW
jgi:DNA helicase II / ATP-dependent DNA helicase PcrA